MRYRCYLFYFGFVNLDMLYIKNDWIFLFYSFKYFYRLTFKNCQKFCNILTLVVLAENQSKQTNLNRKKEWNILSQKFVFRMIENRFSWTSIEAAKSTNLSRIDQFLVHFYDFNLLFLLSFHYFDNIGF